MSIVAPEHTTPFSADRAQDGMPFCCRNGEEVTVVKWDGRAPGFPLVGYHGPLDAACMWTRCGKYLAGDEAGHGLDLVMLPVDADSSLVRDEISTEHTP